MKNTIKRIIKISSLFISLLITVLILQNYFFLHWEHNSKRIREFYNSSDAYDVVLVGASETYTGFSSVQAYQEYGFTSYCYAISSNWAPLIKDECEDILTAKPPQLMVIDVNSFLSDDRPRPYETGIRLFTENIPYSLHRVQTILDQVPLRDSISYLFPIVKYHTLVSDANFFQKAKENYIQVTAEDNYYLQGMITRSLADKLLPYQKKPEDAATADLAEDNLNSLFALLEWLTDHDVENVIFVRFPHKISAEHEEFNYIMKHHKRGNGIGDIVGAYGYEYFDFHNDDSLGLDYLSDFYNVEHVNILGVQKMTSSLGKLIIELGVKPQPLTPEEKQIWDKRVEVLNVMYAAAEEAFLEGKDVSFDDFNIDRLANAS